VEALPGARAGGGADLEECAKRGHGWFVTA
jgi:hypothetical protein